MRRNKDGDEYAEDHQHAAVPRVCHSIPRSERKHRSGRHGNENGKGPHPSWGMRLGEIDLPPLWALAPDVTEFSRLGIPEDRVAHFAGSAHLWHVPGRFAWALHC